MLGGARALLHLIGFDEPFGFSVVEAMACGTPVIAFRRGSMPELIEHGVTGFLVDDVAAAVAAVGETAELDRARDPGPGRGAVRARAHGRRVPRRLRTAARVSHDAPERFMLGVNYWPAAQAMDWLRVYDPAITRRDFARARAAGFDTIRVFLRWEDAQPTADTFDAAVLRRLVDAADAAVEAGVRLIVTLFTGHMSGVNWIPVWAVGGAIRAIPAFASSAGRRRAPPEAGIRNWYGDAAIVEAQERLATATADVLAGHPGVWGWDLGNENSNCTIPPDRASAEAWLERMTTALRRGDPGRPITIGLHMEDLENDRVIGPAEAARWCDVVSMHGYPIYADWAEGSTDSELVPFLAEITRWLAGGAPVLFEEFGAPTTHADAPREGLLDEAAAAEYTGRVLDGLRAVGCRGAFLWCFSDYDSDLASVAPFDAAPHELSFGLWRADGTAKPAVSRGDVPGRRRLRHAGRSGRLARHRRRHVRGGPAPAPPTALRSLPCVEAGSRVAAGKRVGWWDPRGFGKRARGTRIAPGSRPEVARGHATADVTAVRT